MKITDIPEKFMVVYIVVLFAVTIWLGLDAHKKEQAKEKWWDIPDVNIPGHFGQGE